MDRYPCNIRFIENRKLLRSSFKIVFEVRRQKTKSGFHCEIIIIQNSEQFWPFIGVSNKVSQLYDLRIL